MIRLAPPSLEMETCPDCLGSGMNSDQSACRRCGGLGEVIKK